MGKGKIKGNPITKIFLNVEIIKYMMYCLLYSNVLNMFKIVLSQ